MRKISKKNVIMIAAVLVILCIAGISFMLVNMTADTSYGKGITAHAADLPSISEEDYLEDIIDEARLAWNKNFDINHAIPIEPVERQEEEKVAYLTFDDGPGDYTVELLDILDRYDVKATFFVIGSKIEEGRAEILKEITDRGHTIGIHCYDHDYQKLYKSKEAYINDFEKTYQIIYEATGVKPSIFRFPGGSTNNYGKRIMPEIIDELEGRGFYYYDWNVSTGDGGPNTTSEQVLEIASGTFKNYQEPVVLMHDVKKSTVKAVPDLIKMMRKEGYEFDTLNHRKPLGF